MGMILINDIFFVAKEKKLLAKIWHLMAHSVLLIMNSARCGYMYCSTLQQGWLFIPVIIPLSDFNRLIYSNFLYGSLLIIH
jgi:hypothetical protein